MRSGSMALAIALLVGACTGADTGSTTSAAGDQTTEAGPVSTTSSTLPHPTVDL